MQAIPRWRNLFLFKNTIFQSTAVASTSNAQLAQFHSTRISNQKWENKWHSDVRAGQRPSKAYIRYKVHQKRADAKKALKDLLFNSGSLRYTFEETFPTPDTSLSDDEEDHFDEKDRSKSCRSARRAAKAQHRRMKRKLKKQKCYEEMDSSDNVFRTSFRPRGCTWSYWYSRDSFSESSTAGFDWKEHPKKSYRGQQESDIESETDSDNENCAEDMNSERKLLGLPIRGPLKIEDVKKAFHMSALKWHPDKHQGASQGMAGEKFKRCADAYKSLCNSLSSA